MVYVFARTKTSYYLAGRTDDEGAAAVCVEAGCAVWCASGCVVRAVLELLWGCRMLACSPPRRRRACQPAVERAGSEWRLDARGYSAQ